MAEKHRVSREELEQVVRSIDPEELKRRCLEGDWEWLAEKGLADSREKRLKRLGEAVLEYYGIKVEGDG